MRRLLVLALLVSCLAVSLTAVLAQPAGAGGVVPGLPGVFVAITPARALDTRLLGAKAAANTPTNANLTAVGVPTDATAVAVNLTVTEPDADGYITLAPAGVELPFVSNLNFAAGETTANFAVVAVSAGQVQYLSTTSAHVILDVTGFWSPIDGAVTAGRFTPLDATRALDTREGGGMIGPEGRALDVAAFGVPGDARAVAVTLTATEGTQPGYVTAWGGGGAPFVSNLNFVADLAVANFAIVPLDGAGNIRLLATFPTHLVVDISGFFTGTSAPTMTTGAFVANTPARVLDTRDGTGRLAPEKTHDCADFPTWEELNEVYWTYRPGFGDPYQLDGDLDGEPCEDHPAFPGAAVPLTNPNARVPKGGVIHTVDNRAAGAATALVLNLTVTDPEAGGFITAYPTGTTRPWASNVNPRYMGHTRPGLALVATGTSDGVSLYTAVRTHLIADSAGWFIAEP